MNNFLKILSERKSCRSFKSKNLSQEELDAILEAGIQAPSAMNSQSCEIFAIIGEEKYDELANAVKEVLLESHKNTSHHYRFAYHAPVLVIVAGPKDYTMRIEDGSCMLENIFIAATSLNIGSCWINQLNDTQDNEKVRNILTNMGLPENYQVVGCAALGFEQNENPIKEKKKQRIHIVK